MAILGKIVPVCLSIGSRKYRKLGVQPLTPNTGTNTVFFVWGYR